MPRQSDTIDKVQQVADQLLANGQRPTQQAIRDVLGTGSITTINKALNIWWANLAKRVNRQSEHPALPEPVITAASKLWDQALVYSHTILEKQQRENADKLAKKNVNNDQMLIQVQDKLLISQQQNNRLLESNEVLIAGKQELSQRIHELESLLIRKDADNVELVRLNKQHKIVFDKQVTSDDTQLLFQAKIDLKVNERIIIDLRAALEKSESLHNKARQEVTELEKSSMKQIHRLELVIAQQDAKYDNVREQLASFELSGR